MSDGSATDFKVGDLVITTAPIPGLAGTSADSGLVGRITHIDDCVTHELRIRVRFPRWPLAMWVSKHGIIRVPTDQLVEAFLALEAKAHE